LVLIVDDDALFRALVGDVLRRGGYATRETASGQEALQAAHEERPSLTLLDINLGGLSGYDVCRSLRSEFGEELPIVFISGERTEPFDQVAGLRLGADDYILKPFDPGTLLARIDRLVSRQAVRREVVEGADDRFHLTRRELEILKLLVEGLRPKEIALELSISNKTVATHVQNILGKLDVHSQGQAIAVALQSGVVTWTSDDDVSASLARRTRR